MISESINRNNPTYAMYKDLISKWTTVKENEWNNWILGLKSMAVIVLLNVPLDFDVEFCINISIHYRWQRCVIFFI